MLMRDPTEIFRPFFFLLPLLCGVFLHFPFVRDSRHLSRSEKKLEFITYSTFYQIEANKNVEMHFNGFCQLSLRLHAAAEPAVASKSMEIHKKVNILVLNAYSSAATASDNN